MKTYQFHSLQKPFIVFCLLLLSACGSSDGSISDGGGNNNDIIATSAATGLLNDTGITWGGNYPSGNQDTDCPLTDTGFADNTEQDCHQGRDAEAVADTLSKVDGGQAGFDFSKLGSKGNILRLQNATYSTTGSESAGTKWSCVKDNRTGLIWEVKTTDGGLHDKNDKYSWYNTSTATNGGAEGDANADANEICEGYESGNEATYCNTQAFVARVNQATLCGANDWQVPTLEQLRSIVHLGRTYPSIDRNYFPNTPSSIFWSSSPRAYSSDQAWLVYFRYGDDGTNVRTKNYRLRLVRSSQ